MNAVDGLILAIVGISCLISIKRGFVKEALSLLIWIAAAMVSFLFHEKLAFLLTDVIAVPVVRTVAAAVGLFVATLLVGALVNMLIGQLIKLTGLSGTDRVLGVVFGFFRGVIIVMFVMMLFPPMLELEKYELWQSSVLIPHLSAMETGLVKLANQVLGTAA
jgi:membrane protein required for colicin V production